MSLSRLNLRRIRVYLARYSLPVKIIQDDHYIATATIPSLMSRLLKESVPHHDDCVDSGVYTCQNIRSMAYGIRLEYVPRIESETNIMGRRPLMERLHQT